MEYQINSEKKEGQDSNYRFLPEVCKFQFFSKSKNMLDLWNQIKAISYTKSTVLITGESGTGKSVLARNIHQLSKRKGKFVSVHCGAISESLIESELFGHEKGSFTGAIRLKLGKFELANGGTIFLDEIGTISHHVQVKLLQVIQEKFIQRVGGEKDIAIDVQIIAATNTDLKNAVEEKKFREDLFFRLNIFPLEIIPLRKRKEDILGFSQSILKKLNYDLGKGIQGIDSKVEKALNDYPWPGNIRELENILERAYVLEEGKIISEKNIPENILKGEGLFEEESDVQASASSHRREYPIFETLPLHDARRKVIDLFEQKYVQKIFSQTEGDLQKAAMKAGVSARQLQKLLAKYHIKRKEYFHRGIGSEVITKGLHHG